MNMRPYYYLGDDRGLTQLFEGQPFYVYTKDRSITPWIVLGGVWETFVDDILCALARPGDVFLDVGANQGYYTVKIGTRIGPTGRVFAFEPNPAMFRFLADNVEINALRPRATIFAAGAGAAAGKAVMVAQEHYPGGGNILPPQAAETEAEPSALEDAEVGLSGRADPELFDENGLATEDTRAQSLDVQTAGPPSRERTGGGFGGFFADLIGARSRHPSSVDEAESVPPQPPDQPAEAALESQDVQPPSPPPDEAAQTLAPVVRAVSETVFEVDVVRIDDVVPTGLSADLVKIDVEGFEPLVLQGMKEVLDRSPDCAIVCEVSLDLWSRVGEPTAILRAMAGDRRIFRIQVDGVLDELTEDLLSALDPSFVSYVLLLPRTQARYDQIRRFIRGYQSAESG